jgi:hypothetical protein
VELVRRYSNHPDLQERLAEVCRKAHERSDHDDEDPDVGVRAQTARVWRVRSWPPPLALHQCPDNLASARRRYIPAPMLGQRFDQQEPAAGLVIEAGTSRWTAPGSWRSRLLTRYEHLALPTQHDKRDRHWSCALGWTTSVATELSCKQCRSRRFQNPAGAHVVTQWRDSQAFTPWTLIGQARGYVRFA